MSRVHENVTFEMIIMDFWQSEKGNWTKEDIRQDRKSFDCKHCGCWTHKAQQYPMLERTRKQWSGKIAFAGLCFPTRQPRGNGNSHVGKKGERGRTRNAQLSQ